MKVIDHLENAKGATQFTFEILPPLKGQDIQSIFDAIDPLMEFKPPFIDVTYHREEYDYVERENGLLEKRVIRKRPGTVGICAAIQNRYDVDAVPHILCGGFSQEDTENFLIDLAFLGIDNVVALRGDAVKSETYFKACKGGHKYANELVGQIKNLNQGKYLDEEILNCSPTDFCVGVAGYPEKHAEAPSLEFLLELLIGEAVTPLLGTLHRLIHALRALGFFRHRGHGACGLPGDGDARHFRRDCGHCGIGRSRTTTTAALARCPGGLRADHGFVSSERGCKGRKGRRR